MGMYDSPQFEQLVESLMGGRESLMSRADAEYTARKIFKQHARESHAEIIGKILNEPSERNFRYIGVRRGGRYGRRKIETPEEKLERLFESTPAGKRIYGVSMSGDVGTHVTEHGTPVAIPKVRRVSSSGAFPRTPGETIHATPSGLFTFELGDASGERRTHDLAQEALRELRKLGFNPGDLVRPGRAPVGLAEELIDMPSQVLFNLPPTLQSGAQRILSDFVDENASLSSPLASSIVEKQKRLQTIRFRLRNDPTLKNRPYLKRGEIRNLEDEARTLEAEIEAVSQTYRARQMTAMNAASIVGRLDPSYQDANYIHVPDGNPIENAMSMLERTHPEFLDTMRRFETTSRINVSSAQADYRFFNALAGSDASGAHAVVKSGGLKDAVIQVGGTTRYYEPAPGKRFGSIDEAIEWLRAEGRVTDAGSEALMRETLLRNARVGFSVTPTGLPGTMLGHMYVGEQEVLVGQGEGVLARYPEIARLHPMYRHQNEMLSDVISQGKGISGKQEAQRIFENVSTRELEAMVHSIEGSIGSVIPGISATGASMNARMTARYTTLLGRDLAGTDADVIETANKLITGMLFDGGSRGFTSRISEDSARVLGNNETVSQVFAHVLNQDDEFSKKVTALLFDRVPGLKEAYEESHRMGRRFGPGSIRPVVQEAVEGWGVPGTTKGVIKHLKTAANQERQIEAMTADDYSVASAKKTEDGWVDVFRGMESPESLAYGGQREADVARNVAGKYDLARVYKEAIAIINDPNSSPEKVEKARHLIRRLRIGSGGSFQFIGDIAEDVTGLEGMTFSDVENSIVNRTFDIWEHGRSQDVNVIRGTIGSAAGDQAEVFDRVFGSGRWVGTGMGQRRYVRSGMLGQLDEEIRYLRNLPPSELGEGTDNAKKVTARVRSILRRVGKSPEDKQAFLQALVEYWDTGDLESLALHLSNRYGSAYTKGIKANLDVEAQAYEELAQMLQGGRRYPTSVVSDARMVEREQQLAAKAAEATRESINQSRQAVDFATNDPFWSQVYGNTNHFGGPTSSVARGQLLEARGTGLFDIGVHEGDEFHHLGRFRLVGVKEVGDTAAERRSGDMIEVLYELADDTNRETLLRRMGLSQRAIDNLSGKPIRVAQRYQWQKSADISPEGQEAFKTLFGEEFYPSETAKQVARATEGNYGVYVPTGNAPYIEDLKRANAEYIGHSSVPNAGTIRREEIGQEYVRRIYGLLSGVDRRDHLGATLFRGDGSNVILNEVFRPLERAGDGSLAFGGDDNLVAELIRDIDTKLQGEGADSLRDLVELSDNWGREVINMPNHVVEQIFGDIDASKAHFIPSTGKAGGRVFNPLSAGSNIEVPMSRLAGYDPDLIEKLISEGLLSSEGAEKAAQTGVLRLNLGQMFARAAYLKGTPIDEIPSGILGESSGGKFYTDIIGEALGQLSGKATGGGLRHPEFLSRVDNPKVADAVNNLLTGRSSSGAEASATEEVIDATKSRRGQILATGEEFAKLWKSNKSLRWGTYALGAVAVASMIQGRRKKDHTQQDISGPPHLPGGSPYENPAGPVTMPHGSYSPGNNMGMTYHVSASGSFDPSALSADIQRISGGRMTNNYRNAGSPFAARDKRIQDLMDGYS